MIHLAQPRRMQPLCTNELGMHKIATSTRQFFEFPVEDTCKACRDLYEKYKDTLNLEYEVDEVQTPRSHNLLYVKY